MSTLGGFSGQQAVQKFERLGYSMARQRGSHIRLHHPDSSTRSSLTIPLHRELKKGLLVRLIKDAGLTVEQFVDL